jgi:hypothetical protein
MKNQATWFTLAALALVAQNAHCQGTNVIYQKLFAAQITPATSATVRSVGAQFNQLSVNLGDVGGAGNCATHNVPAAYWDMHLEASNDGVAWFQVGQALTQLNAVGTRFINVPASFQYQRGVLAVNPLQAYCSVTAWYSGSQTGAPTSSAPNSSNNDQFAHTSYPLEFQKGTYMGQLGTCSATNGASATTAAVYSLTVSNLDVLPLTLQLGYYNPGSTTPTAIYATVAIPPSSTFTFPHGPRPYFTPYGQINGSAVNAGWFFGAYVTSAAPSGYIFTTYRCE